jgi:hypothetical protein
MAGSVVFAALLLAGVLLANAGNSPAGVALMAGSLIAFLWMVFSGRGESKD